MLCIHTFGWLVRGTELKFYQIKKLNRLTAFEYFYLVSYCLELNARVNVVFSKFSAFERNTNEFIVSPEANYTTLDLHFDDFTLAWVIWSELWYFVKSFTSTSWVELIHPFILAFELFDTSWYDIDLLYPNTNRHLLTSNNSKRVHILTGSNRSCHIS